PLAVESGPTQPIQFQACAGREESNAHCEPCPTKKLKAFLGDRYTEPCACANLLSADQQRYLPRYLSMSARCPPRDRQNGCECRLIFHRIMQESGDGHVSQTAIFQDCSCDCEEMRDIRNRCCVTDLTAVHMGGVQ